MKTLFPFAKTPTTGLKEWLDGPPHGRFQIEFDKDLDEPVLTEEWRISRLEDGRAVWVRSAPCGLGCHCSGEFSLVVPRG